MGNPLMVAGNQLAKGNPGGGRKGYEFEAEQLERMIAMFSKYLNLLDKVLDDRAEEKDFTKLEKVGADMRKILDKLHASKEKKEVDAKIEFKPFDDL